MIQTDICRLDPKYQREAAGVLARAFFDDPLTRFYLPDTRQRSLALPGIMSASLRYCLLYGEVDTTASMDGFACWLPPGQTETKWWRLLRAGWGVVPLRMGLAAGLRVSRIEPQIDRLHRGMAPDPHWYLMVLGVEPARQGHGVGGRLIAHRLEAAREGGLPVYLETMTERDVRFYQKHGFEVASELPLPKYGLHVWAMLKR